MKQSLFFLTLLGKKEINSQVEQLSQSTFLSVAFSQAKKEPTKVRVQYEADGRKIVTMNNFEMIVNFLLEDGKIVECDVSRRWNEMAMRMLEHEVGDQSRQDQTVFLLSIALNSNFVILTSHTTDIVTIVTIVNTLFNETLILTSMRMRREDWMSNT